MKILLVVSLALNLLVVGIFAGARFLHPFGAPGPFASSFGFSLVRFGLTRGGETREETRRVLSENKGKIDPLRKELRAARRGVADALSAEPFDPVQFRAAQSRVVELERQVGEQSLDALTAIAARMSAEDRRDFVRHWPRRAFRERGSDREERDERRP
jgi:uncharacterized membrane protein